MKKLLILTLILSLVLGSTVFAQQGTMKLGDCDGPHGKLPGMGKYRGMRGDGPGIKGILAHGDEINLTDQQRKQLENMMTEFQTQHVDQKAELQKARIQLQALKRDKAAENEVNAAIDKVASLRAKMQKARYANRQKVEAVLTAEQIGKLKDLKKKAKCNMPCMPGGKAKGPGPGGIDG